MLQALSGFAIIWTVIAVGWLAAHLGTLDRMAQQLLNRIAFLVASPALLLTTVAKAPLTHLFSSTLGVSISAILLTAGTYLLLNRLTFRHGLGAATVGWMCAAYTNAGNLGLPIAQHVLGDAAWMAPIMLLQVGILQPFALACLDIARARADGVRLRPLRYVSLPFRNPITVGILIGLVLNLTAAPVPAWLMDAVTMVGGMAVPMMLLAFGVSLRLDPLPGRGEHAREVWTLQALKILAMPGLALLIGCLAGLAPHDLLAVTVIAGLPTAQNVFTISSRYKQAMPVARDSVFWSTILSVPLIVAAATLIH